MQISSITDIVDGELQNSPSISFVYNIKINPKRVIEGDVFIAKNPKDLNLAIRNGAFAIIYDFKSDILDDEIAWIKVESCSNSLVKLFRFKLSSLDIKAYFCDKFTYELLHIYKSHNKSIKFISENLENSIKIIENINTNDTIFCTSSALLDNIYPNNYDFNSNDYLTTNLTSHSLFESSFSYNDYYYSRLKISSLYSNQFLDVSNFLDDTLDLSKLKKISNFRPIFIDKFINIIDYGRSDKFIVTQKHRSLVNNEVKYLKENYKYAKTIYVTSEYLENFSEQQYVVSSLKRLKEFLKSHQFNCAYLIGYDFFKVEKALSKPSNNNLLF